MIVLSILGGLMMFVGGIWTLVLAFKKSLWWGLGSIFVPFVSLIFCLLNLSETWKPLVITLAGGLLFGVGTALGGGFTPPAAPDAGGEEEEEARLQRRGAIVWVVPA